MNVIKKKEKEKIMDYKWKDYEKLALWYVSKKLRETSVYNKEDFLQEAYLIFVNCKNKYNEDMGKKFSTYFVDGMKIYFYNLLYRKIIPKNKQEKYSYNEKNIDYIRKANKEEIKYDYNGKINVKIIT